jgi:single-strand DNA-binding protein
MDRIVASSDMTGRLDIAGTYLWGVIPGGFMNNLNSILIEGNLVRDPLYRSTAKGTSLCTFSLASNRYYKQDSQLEKEVGFFDVETWAKLAENCNNLGHKGRGVRVVGRLKQDRWTGTDGKPHSRVTIVAEHVEFRPEFKKDKEKAAEGEAEEAVETESLSDEDSMSSQYAEEAAENEVYETAF